MNHQPIYTMQGNTPVVLYSCGVCQCYIGKCTAASFPADEIPVCKQCRDARGYGDRPVTPDELTAPPEDDSCGLCQDAQPGDLPHPHTMDDETSAALRQGEPSGPNPCVCGRRDQCTYWDSPCPYRFDDELVPDGADDRPIGDRFF